MSSAYDPYRQLPGRPGMDTKLPAPPPGAGFHAPLPPPKFSDSGYPQYEPEYSAPRQPPASLQLEPPQDSFGNVMHMPITPTTLVVPSPTTESKPKKSNPLVDLIETEKQYVDQLIGIIRKVAAAWSRSNLPPPQLDGIFRTIEAIYRSNKGLLNKLKEIGMNPSNPKALGDLLMRWVDDLDTPYTAYAQKYLAGFDAWGPVRNNGRLPGAMVTFAASCPPPPGVNIWTLDALFLLPKQRLQYYRKLYNRLLKSTAPGRSDHRLLVGALDKLDTLLYTLDDRANLFVSDMDNTQNGQSRAPAHAEGQAIVDTRPPPRAPKNTEYPPTQEHENTPVAPSPAASASSGWVSLSSPDIANTSVTHGSTPFPLIPVTELEHMLSAEQTLDIFTMTPKMVRLQMSPPTLIFKREVRLSGDVVIRFIPRATGTEVLHRLGHIFLLSDLFLICEWMTPQEKAAFGPSGPELWLRYPPLSGKVLRLGETPGRDSAFEVSIMRKETLIIECSSPQARVAMMAEFQECINFATSLPPPSKEAPPPVPSLPSMTQSSSAPAVTSPPPLSPPRPPKETMPSQSPLSKMQGDLQRDMDNMTLSPDDDAHLPPAPPTANDNILPSNPPPNHPPSFRSGPPGHPVSNGPPYRQNSLAPQDTFGQQPIGPGQFIPPPRTASAGPPSLGPGQFIPPERTQSAGPGPRPPRPVRNPTLESMNSQPQPPPMNMRPGMPSGMAPHPGAPSPVGSGNGGFAGPPMMNNQPSPYQPPNPGFYPNRQQTASPGAMSGPPAIGRPPSDPASAASSMRGPPSIRSMASSASEGGRPPFMNGPGSGPGTPAQSRFPPGASLGAGPGGAGPLHAPQPRAILPSMQVMTRDPSIPPTFAEPSPPGSPIEETPQPTGPVTNKISAEMKCKVFLKQHHAQWKNLGSAKLKLYQQEPTNIKQLVVEANSSKSSPLISTIILTDGVERVGKTGVAVELSDQGARTGIVYMLQLKNEATAGELFDSLLAGSDRA